MSGPRTVRQRRNDRRLGAVIAGLGAAALALAGWGATFDGADLGAIVLAVTAVTLAR